jgi:hypothetical protein
MAPFIVSAFSLSPQKATKWNTKSTPCIPKRTSPAATPSSLVAAIALVGTWSATLTTPSPCNLTNASQHFFNVALLALVHRQALAVSVFFMWRRSYHARAPPIFPGPVCGELFHRRRWHFAGADGLHSADPPARPRRFVPAIPRPPVDGLRKILETKIPQLTETLSC